MQPNQIPNIGYPNTGINPRTGLFLKGGGYAGQVYGNRQGMQMNSPPAIDGQLSGDVVPPAPNGTYDNTPYFDQGSVDTFRDGGPAGAVPYGPHNGYGPTGYGDEYGSECENLFVCTGFMYDSCSYFIGETLYWNREDGEIFGGNFFNLDDFDEQWGGRFTYGRRVDEMYGWELSYFGFDAFLSETTQRSPTGQLIGNLFGTTAGFNSDAFFSSFRGATFLDQVQKSRLHSLEWNKVWWGWDVAKLYHGARFIHFNDSLRLTSFNVAQQTGSYSINIQNNLFGYHIGGELFYDVGYRLSFSCRAKAGLFLNANDGQTRFTNAGTPILRNSDEDVDLSAALEFGVTAHYQLLPRLRAITSFDIFHLEDVATIESNYSAIITPTTGRFYNDTGDATFSGFGFGIEWYR